MNMQDLSAVLDQTIDTISRLRAKLRKGTNRQVRSSDERMLVKAAAQSWFRSHRPALVALAAEPSFASLDAGFAKILEFSDQNTQRSKYSDLLADLKSKAVQLRSRAVVSVPATQTTQPTFARLISDVAMVAILERRWAETIACIGAGAHLAATVMMGGLLEAVLLARVNQMANPKPVFTAANAPKDRSGKTRPLKEWTLKDYLDVANELGWIRQSAKDVGQVLRDYRNYIHPEKERSHGVTVNGDDTAMFLTILSSLCTQVIASVKP